MNSYEDYDENDRKSNIRTSLICFIVCIVNFLIAIIVVLAVKRTMETLLTTILGGLLPIAATQFNLWCLRNPTCSECSCYGREYEEQRATVGVVIFMIMSIVLPWVGMGLALKG